MIICQNCGTTNNELISHTCRKCGALLPVSSKSSRRLKSEKKKKEKQQPQEQLPIEAEQPKEVKKEKFELQEIPKGIDEPSISPPIEESDNDIKSSESNKSEPLQEIPAQPYRGTILDTRKGFQPPSLPTPTPRTSNTISDALMELKNSVLDSQESKPTIPPSPIPVETNDSKESALKQKRLMLEKDMTEVLGFLSKKISVKKLDIPKPKEKEEPEKKIPPSSMSEILRQLLTLDLNIEASAIIKTDGTILASAISSRISDSLFATIGMNLSMIGSDIIDGLDAGALKSISVRGSDGVLDLAPIDKEDPNVKDMFLIIFSHSKVKSGIIAFAANIVKKQLKEYLGLKK